MIPTLAEHLYDDRRARDCEGEDRFDYAPDGWGWNDHDDDFALLLERIDGGFDFSQSDAPLQTSYRVVIKREAAEAEARRIGVTLAPGRVVVEIDCPERNAAAVTPRDLGEDWWPEGIPCEAVERFAGYHTRGVNLSEVVK